MYALVYSKKVTISSFCSGPGTREKAPAAMPYLQRSTPTQHSRLVYPANVELHRSGTLLVHPADVISTRRQVVPTATHHIRWQVVPTATHHIRRQVIPTAAHHIRRQVIPTATHHIRRQVIPTATNHSALTGGTRRRQSSGHSDRRKSSLPASGQADRRLLIKIRLVQPADVISTSVKSNRLT